MFAVRSPMLSAMSLSLAVFAAGCGDEEKTTSQNSDAAMEADASVADSPIQPAIACDDKEADLYGDPGALPEGRGAILRCVDDGFIPQADVQARLEELESGSNRYAGKKAEGGAHVYRVLYKTERGNGAAGTSVATIVLPEKPRTEKLPLLLLARGSRGQAPGCAPSRLVSKTERDKSVTVDVSDNKDGRYVHDDFESMLWPLVAGGFAVVATDSAGYANYGAPNNPASGYAQITDMGKSFIDSAYALKNLASDATTDDVVMVGLSQGGHTVLGSLQVANEYKAPGPIKGAAVYAPLWFSQRGWGLVVDRDLTKLYELKGSSAVPVSVWYHYTHAELLDGPGEGVKLFKPEYQAAIKDFVDNSCWSQTYDSLVATGVTYARDLYDPAFADAASSGAAFKNCSQADDKALCEKWLTRYQEDRPVLTGEAANVPLLIAWGEKDTTITPSFLQCGIDSLKKSANTLDFCVDPRAGHSGVVLTQSTYVNEWLSAKALGTKIDASCPKKEAPSGPDFVCAPVQLTD